MISQTFFRQRAAAVRHATRVLHSDPFQLHHAVPLQAVRALCDLAILGFPTVAESMSDPERAGMDAYRAEIKDGFMWVDCPSCDGPRLCVECDCGMWRALRVAKRAYALTA